MNRDEARAKIPEAATLLGALSAALDDDLHELYLFDRTVYWMFTLPDQPGWTVEVLEAPEAVHRLGDISGAVRDRVVSLGYEDFPDPQRVREADEAAIEDLTQVMLAALPSDPHRAERALQRRRQEYLWEMWLLARVRAALVEQAVASLGGGYGSVRKAAQVLGISEAAVTKARRLRGTWNGRAGE